MNGKSPRIGGFRGRSPIIEIWYFYFVEQFRIIAYKQSALTLFVVVPLPIIVALEFRQIPIIDEY
jgi:hypothetical protein